jgi:ABC-type transport system substrate-binding protein
MTKRAAAISLLTIACLYAGSGLAADKYYDLSRLSLMPTSVQNPAALEGAKSGGTFRIGIEADIRSFDVIKAGVFDFSAIQPANAIMEPLFNLDLVTRQMHPNLAVGYSESEDKKTYVIKLRDGVKFHDGSDFSAEDVGHHFNRILNPKNRARARSFISPIQTVEVVDRLTLKFTLEHPWQPFLLVLCSRGEIGLIPSKAAVEAKTQSKHPVGTGPFLFDTWNRGSSMTVKSNPDYWARKMKLVPEGSPFVDAVQYRVLPDNQSRYASLKGGEVDAIWTERGATIVRAQKESNLVVHRVDGSGANMLVLNTRKPPLDDVRVRRAVAHAWNQTVINKVLSRGTTKDVKHPYSGLIDCGTANFREYDLKKAKEYADAFGKPIVLEMNHTTTPRGRELTSILQQALKKVGITLTPKPMEEAALVSRIFRKKFQLSGWRIVDSIDQGPQMAGLTHSSSGYNLSGYKSKELDALVLKVRTGTDLGARNTALCGIAEIVNDQATMLMRGGLAYHVITGKRVRAMQPPAYGLILPHEVWLDR